MRGALTAGSWRGPSRSTAGMLAVRERTGCADLRCSQDGDGRRSGALFGARADVVDRRLGCGRRHGQLWLPSAVLFLCVRGWQPPCLLQLLRPERHLGDGRCLVIPSLSGNGESGDAANSPHRRADLVDIQLGPDPEPFRVWVDLGGPPIFIPPDGEGRPTVLPMHRYHDSQELAVSDRSPRPGQLISDLRSHSAPVLPLEPLDSIVPPIRPRCNRETVTKPSTNFPSTPMSGRLTDGPVPASG